MKILFHKANKAAHEVEEETSTKKFKTRAEICSRELEEIIMKLFIIKSSLENKGECK